METSSASRQQRRRARMACEPCRQSKRKCDGDQPCGQCAKFDLQCFYRSKPRQRARKAQDTGSSAPAATITASESPLETRTSPNDVFTQSLESNSGSTFVRNFAQTVDPTSKALFPFLGYNIWLGERQVPASGERRRIVDILSEDDIRELVDVYASKVHGCYGFLEMPNMYETVRSRWQLGEGSSTSDAVLSGVAALGCLFSRLKTLEVEAQLIRLAKELLEASAEPSVDNVNGWLLRTVYLRLCAKPEVAWISSCITLHAIDAAGLHAEDDAVAVLHIVGRRIDAETRRRLFGVARHLNVWLSFDLARSRVVLQNSSLVVPSPRSEDYSSELLGLLPYTEVSI